MKCLDCGGGTQVIDSRAVASGVKRRRSCLNCGHRYTTFEIAEADYRKVRNVVKRAAALALMATELSDALDPSDGPRLKGENLIKIKPGG